MKEKHKFKYRKTEAEKFLEYEDLIALLRNACEAIDGGADLVARAQTKIVAAVLYTLLHDGGSNKALLRRLGVRDQLLLPETAALFPTLAKRQGLPLASIHLDPSSNSKKVAFVAKLESAAEAPRVKFGKWWEGKIFSLRPNLMLSRRTLVNVMRSQAGLGHSDDILNNLAYCYLEKKGIPHAKYYNATKAKLLKVHGSHIYAVRKVPPVDAAPPPIESGPFPIANGPQASVRQIAWELDFALRDLGY
jgi:hypothetical protein